MRLKCIGATETVTGSKHLLETETNERILLDCGLFQGLGKATDELNRHLGVDPSALDAVVLSHAHIDHSGNLPLLVKQGFKGHIYCTLPTLILCEVLLMDSAHIQQSDIAYINKKREAEDKEPLKPLYTPHDVEKCLRHFRTVPYNADFFVTNSISIKFTDAGHILGSAVVNLTVKENGKVTRFCYTGDVGRYNDLILKDPAVFPQADYIVCESTYGDRLHEPDINAEERLLEIVMDTCVEKRGKLIIPAFSLGRTQEIVYVLDKLKNAGKLPDIKIYVDSPLSTDITDIMREHVTCFNERLQEYIKTDPDPFGFSNLRYIREKNDSMALNESKEPCIIIAASGMMDAGRIKHHLANSISNPRNTVLVVGYCTPGSLGGDIREKKAHVRIFGKPYDVKARIEVLDNYSAHADYQELIRFLSCQDKKVVKEVFLVHGEQAAKLAFKEKLQAEGFTRVTLPHPSETFIL